MNNRKPLNDRLAGRLVACGGIAALAMSMFMGVSISWTPSGINYAQEPSEGVDIAMTDVAPEVTDVTGGISWHDDDDAAGIRPDVVKVRLQDDAGNVVAESETSAEDSWQYAFSDVKTADESGNPISYYVSSDSVQPYVTESNGYDIVNTYSADSIAVAVNVVWNDDEDRDVLRPDSVTVELSRENDDEERKCVITAEDDWSYTFTDVAPRANNKRQGWVAAEEVDPRTNHEYSITVDNAGANTEDQTVTITNYHKPYETYITINNVWDDEANERGVRPEKVAMTVLGSDGSSRQIELTREDAVADETAASPGNGDTGNAGENVRTEPDGTGGADNAGEPIEPDGTAVDGKTATMWRKSSEEPLYRFNKGQEIEYTVVTDSIEIDGENAESYESNYDFVADVDEEIFTYDVRYEDEGDNLEEGYKQLAQEAPKHTVSYQVNLDMGNIPDDLKKQIQDNYSPATIKHVVYDGDAAPAAPSLSSAYKNFEDQVRKGNPDIRFDETNKDATWSSVPPEITENLTRTVIWKLRLDTARTCWMFAKRGNDTYFIIGRYSGSGEYVDPAGKTYHILSYGKYSDNIDDCETDYIEDVKFADIEKNKNAVPGWIHDSNKNSTTKIRIDTNIHPTSMFAWFSAFSNVEEVDLKYCDFGQCRNMRDLFARCAKLTASKITWNNDGKGSLNVPELRTIRGAFWGCGAFSSSDDTDILKLFSNAPKLVSMRGILAETVNDEQTYNGPISFNTEELPMLRDMRQMFQGASKMDGHYLNIEGKLGNDRKDMQCYRLSNSGETGTAEYQHTGMKVRADGSWRHVMTRSLTSVDGQPGVTADHFEEVNTKSLAQSAFPLEQLLSIFSFGTGDSITLQEQQTRYSKSGFVVNRAGESVDKGQGRTLGDKKLTLTVHHRIKKIEGAPVIAPPATVMPPAPIAKAEPQAPAPTPARVEPQPAALALMSTPVAALGDLALPTLFSISGAAMLACGLWMAHRRKRG